MIEFMKWLNENANEHDENGFHDLTAYFFKKDMGNRIDRLESTLPNLAVAYHLNDYKIANTIHDLISLYFFSLKFAKLDMLEWIMKINGYWGVNTKFNATLIRDVEKASLRTNKDIVKAGEEVYVVPNNVGHKLSFGIGTEKIGLFASIDSSEILNFIKYKPDPTNHYEKIKKLAMKSPSEVFSLKNIGLFGPVVKYTIRDKWLKSYEDLLDPEEYCNTVTELIMSLESFRPTKIRNVYLEVYEMMLEQVAEHVKRKAEENKDEKSKKEYEKFMQTFQNKKHLIKYKLNRHEISDD